MPNNFVTAILWSIRSKAFEKSVRTRVLMFPPFRPLKLCGDRYQSNSEWLKHPFGYHIVCCQFLSWI